jgi:ribosome-binding factor A
MHMMKQRQAQGPSQRQLRAGELIRHALAEILMRGETGDPELERLKASVHEVQVAPDLKIATAYVRSLVPGSDEALLAALNRNRKYLRGLIAPRLDMKFMPDIRYRIDTALDYASRIDDILNSPAVARDLRRDKE